MDFLNQYCKNLKLISIEPGYFGRSSNLNIETVRIPTQAYAIDYESIDLGVDVSEPFKLAVQREFEARLSAIKYGEPFQWVLPIHSIRLGSGGGVPIVASDAISGSEQIEVSGLPANTVSWLYYADALGIASHTKLYKVAEPVSSNMFGEATIKLLNPLVSSVTAGTQLNVDNVEITVIKDPEQTEIELSRIAGDPDLQSISLRFIEKL